MSGPIHTYGPTCLLSDDDPDPTSWHSLETPPRVRPQFFYTSSLPIDDPLSSLPPSSGSKGPANERAPPQPFSVKDNIALEEAWICVQKTIKQKTSRNSLSREDILPKRNPGIYMPARNPALESERGKHIGKRGDGSLTGSITSSPSVNALSLDDESAHLGSGSAKATSNTVQPGERSRRATLDRHVGETDRTASPGRRKRELSPSGHSYPVRLSKKISGVVKDDETTVEGHEDSSPRGAPSRDASISGSPFARAAPSQPQTPLGRSLESIPPSDENQPLSGEMKHSASKQSGLRNSYQIEEYQDRTAEDSDDPSGCKDGQLKIPVGVSRLHLVELPNLKMKPIYWSPLHDISNVLRATWFYRNTMLPVETELANKLEDGYNYLKPWTGTWQDELNSCVENGADAEMKIVQKLWVQDTSRPQSRTAATRDSSAASPDPSASGKSAGSPADTAQFDFNRAAGGSAVNAEAVKPYLSASVIYVDGKDAQILRPSLLPSVSRGRRPLSAIRKGRQIGIPVVRGFSRRLWDQLYPPKPNPVDVRNYLRSTQSRSMSSTSGRPICYACAMEGSRPTPTDLVLVIHGIGQKLSERMESFHFTHAINTFRRNINVELNSEQVWPHVREGHGGIMVLPVNWRSTLSLDDVNLESGDANDPAANHFSLKDITPETIPAVRSLISDVMLDIPYYLSHHKPKMIRAVVKEANRVFRLWCKNNPGFQQNGRVHLLAHSLGSAMAMDILSHQPTKIPHFDFPKTRIHEDIFEFDTKNLFICGSPAGFFLLLNKGNLLPRRGRDKPGSEGEDRLRGVAGEADTYGCLAVDNLYNIMHTTDPIAYRVNATVDSDLAASLKPASIPSSSASFWSSFSSVFRWSSSTAASTFAPSAPTRRPAPPKLPSNVELETHDFTREEIAEKRMLLLNDNGQIDYFLSGGGGPLNIQYLNMLSAHSSYWTLTDFVRFLVIEVARGQGRDRVLPALKAEKRRGSKVHRKG